MRALARALIAGVGLWAGVVFAAGPPTLAIGLQKQSFVPATTSVAVGTRITWRNGDDVPHSVTADDKRFDSGPLQPGQTFEWTADRAGPVAYHCIFHPSMTAVLNVGPPAK